MDTPAHPGAADLKLLHAHREWLERLSLRLVGDEHAAADLVQDTLMALLVHRPEQRDGVRGWLRAVLVHGVIRYRKTEAFRRAREVARERDDEFPSAEEVFERTNAHRRLVEAVMSLKEPYRSTLLYRFYDEFPPRVIAEKTGTPVETVKTRIKRGLVMLRAKLEDDSPDGVLSVAVLLAPILTRGLPRVPVAAKVVAAAALLLGGGTLGWWTLSRSADDRAPSTLAQLEEPTPSAPATRSDDDATVRSAAAADDHAPVVLADAEQPARATQTYDGIAYDLDGEPLADLAVGVIEGEFDAYRAAGVEYIRLDEDAVTPLGTTDAEGRFAIPVAHRGSLLCTIGEDHANLLPAVVGTHPGAINALVCGPAFALEGLVLDATGHPVAGATVKVELPRSFRARFDHALTNSIQTVWHARSDEAGLYRIEGLAYLADATVTAGDDRHGYIEARLPRPDGGRAVLDLELGGLEGTRLTARGVVRDGDGHALAGVCVHFGADHLHTNAEGRFEVFTDAAGSGNRRFPCPPARLAFHRAGFSTLLVARDPVTGRFGLDLTLTLAPEGAPITGVVRDTTGRPVAGARVALSIPDADPLSKRYNCAHTDLSEFETSVTTDDDGSFALPCPADLDVGVVCTQSAGLRGTRVASGVRAGDEVELTLQAEEQLVAPTVLVVDDEEVALGGATVTVFRADNAGVGEAPAPLPGSAKMKVVTGPDGRAQLPPLATEGLIVLVRSPDSVPTSAPLATSPANDLVVVRVPRRCWIGVDLSAAGDLYRSTGCYGRFLDERGEVVHLYEQHGHGGVESPLLLLDRGRSAVVSIPSNVRTLEILHGPQLVGLASVSPRPGETIWVRELH